MFCPRKRREKNKLRVYKLCWHRSCQLRLEVRNSGPVHMYSDIFENKHFFSPFLKKYVSTRSVFQSISPVYTKTLKR